MAAVLPEEQLQPDDLSVRPGRPEQPALSQLSRLLRPAGPAEPLRCHHQQCSFETLSRAALDEHARSHAGRRFYECDVCRMRFTNGANLRRHRMRHTGFKPYECRACSKRFFRRDHLLEHMSTHAKAAGRRLPWQCPVCGKGFQRQIAMRAHYQNEHVRDGDWSGVCRLCGFGASSQQSLHAHLATQHGLQLGSAPAVPAQGPAQAASPGPAPAQLLLAHHFLAPLELRPDTESPPASPRPSQVSPNSSEASPHSSCQVSPGASDGGAVKTEPHDPPAPREDEDGRQGEEQEDEERQEQQEDGQATIASLLARTVPPLTPNNGEQRRDLGGSLSSDLRWNSTTTARIRLSVYLLYV